MAKDSHNAPGSNRSEITSQRIENQATTLRREIWPKRLNPIPQQLEVVFTQEGETPGTVWYKADELFTLYLRKSGFQGSPPSELTTTFRYTGSSAMVINRRNSGKGRSVSTD